MFIFIRSDYFKHFATHSTLERDGFEVASERVSLFLQGKGKAYVILLAVSMWLCQQETQGLSVVDLTPMSKRRTCLEAFN